VDEASPDRADPYLWLEEVEGARALAWVREQNRRTEAALCDEAFEADRLAIYENLTQPTNIPAITRRGEHVYNFWQDATHVRGLWRRTSLDSYREPEPAWETVLDLDRLAVEEGADWVWQGCQSFEPEHRRGLVRLSRGGADAATFLEFDLVEKRFVADGFVVPEAKGGTNWIDADTLLLWTALGPDAVTTSGYPRKVRRWRRGEAPLDAAIVFEVEEGDISASGQADIEPGFERLLFRRQITFEDGETYLVAGKGPPVRLDLPLDSRHALHRDWLVVKLKTDWDAGGRRHPAGALLAIRLSRFLAGGRHFEMLFEPSPRRTLASFWWGKSRLVLSLLDNLKSEVRLATPGGGGWTVERLPGVPEAATAQVGPLDAGGLPRSDDMLLWLSSFLNPDSLSLVSPDGAITPLKEAPAAFDTSGLAVTQHEAVASDGERIPYYQVGPADASGPQPTLGSLPTLGPQPTLMTGYGGFNVPMRPSYLGNAGRVWLSKGGVYVLAALRGGGEFGPAWHKAGMREGKRLAHDDFAAIARDLVARGVTTPALLACSGGSNGGLLVGNMLTRYPELFGAIWCSVPLLDMRRYTKLLAGASWIAEYGDPDDPEDWAFLQSLSAYHAVEPGRAYPPILFVTSRRDDRVHPGHARKMAAKLQALGAPALFYEPEDGGHGAANKAQAAFLSALGYAHLRNTIADGGGPS
jgi:prolyl oligopeptidase